MNDRLEQKLKMLPESPGVYVMLDADGQVIYVGKAKILKNRVKQYFYSGFKNDKVAAMVRSIDDFYYIMTASEVDALSLENNLIKKHKPKYNILLKDDKTYPYLKIDLKKDFPRLEITRRIKRDGAKYFGPFMGGVNVREILEIINQCYMLRSCSTLINSGSKKRECLNYHIKLCPAPCSGRISVSDYRKNVEKALDFLSGNDESAKEILTNKMHSYSDSGEFELAITARDKLKMLEKIAEKKITSINRFINADVVAVYTDKIYAAANLLFIRGGRMQGGKYFSLSASVSGDDSEILSELIRRYYKEGAELPDEIIIGEELSDGEVIKQYFKENANKNVVLTVPSKGIKRELYQMAKNNARDYLEKAVDNILHKEDMTIKACERLKDILKLKRYPKRMECYDISNISGVDKVASMVVFSDGEKDASSYRRFMIKTVEGANDFASLKEALTRRLKKLGTSEEENFPKPDLIIIDGGKGQLSSVEEVFLELGVSDIDLISLAKREEEVFTVHFQQPVIIDKHDYVLRMLQRIRDEAHRFAITYFRSKFLKRSLSSALDEINGIGKAKKAALIEEFKSLQAIKRASITELERVDGIGKKHAAAIFNYFNADSKKEE